MDPRQLARCKKRLSSATPLLGGWLRRRAVAALASAGCPEAVRLLAEAAAGSPDEQVQHLVLEALRQLAAGGGIEAREALCRLVVVQDHLQARDIAVQAGYAPREASQRALFYILTEQWDRYESLDFDHSLLRALYQAAAEPLKKRLAEKARRAGRVDWVQVVSGGRQGRRLAEMTDAEWQAVLEALSTGQHWPEAWRLAQEAPPCWSRALLEQLQHSVWRPQGAERTGLEELLRLAQAWQEPDLSSLIRCQKTLQGHTEFVACLVISPDGRLLASGSDDQMVRLWGLPEGRPLQTLKGHTNWVSCLAISPDGRLLARGSGDQTVRLWGLPEGRPLQTLRHTGPVECLAISPDGRLLASGSDDQTVRLWGLPEGRPLQTLKGHTDRVGCLAISPDGRLLASGSTDNTVRLWGLPGGRPLQTLKGHTYGVSCLAISPDGWLLASGSGDQTVRLWGLPEGRPLQTLHGHTSWGGICLAISPDGRLLASGSTDNTVRLWGLPGGRPLQTLQGHTDYVWCLAISPDGRLLVSGSTDQTVRLWGLPEGRPLHTLQGHTSPVSCVAISPDGRLLASGSTDKTVRLWTSELVRLARLPVKQMTQQDLTWVQETLRRENLTAAQRQDLEFIVALLCWRQRFDIQIGEATRRVTAGTFDIEIEG